MGRTTVTIECSEAVTEELESLAAGTGQDVAAMLAKCLILYRECVDAVRAGKFVGVCGSQGPLEVEFTGLIPGDEDRDGPEGEYVTLSRAELDELRSMADRHVVPAKGSHVLVLAQGQKPPGTLGVVEMADDGLRVGVVRLIDPAAGVVYGVESPGPKSDGQYPHRFVVADEIRTGESAYFSLSTGKVHKRLPHDIEFGAEEFTAGEQMRAGQTAWAGPDGRLWSSPGAARGGGTPKGDGLIAGERLAAGSWCFVGDDGLVRQSGGTKMQADTDIRGSFTSPPGGTSAAPSPGHARGVVEAGGTRVRLGGGREEETSGQFLRRLGVDGSAWAAEMHSRFPSIPKDELLGWCCNMIMAGVDSVSPDPVPADGPQELTATLKSQAPSPAPNVQMPAGSAGVVMSKTDVWDDSTRTTTAVVWRSDTGRSLDDMGEIAARVLSGGAGPDSVTDGAHAATDAGVDEYIDGMTGGGY